MTSPRLIKVADWSGEKRGNLVFVHGLGGHPYDTWRRYRWNWKRLRTELEEESFWPIWFARDLKGLSVFTLGYVSPPSNWLGTSMPVLDQASLALRVLRTSADLKTGPIYFICHSLGGLIVKNAVRAANEQQYSDPELADLLTRTHLVVFIATPHTGSDKATLLERIRFLAWGTDSVRDLVANTPELRHLNFAYREAAKLRGDNLHHLAYYEMVGTLFGWIVRPNSADPGLECRPTPLLQDHITIAKPSRRDDLVYSEPKKLLSELSAEPANPGKLRIYPLEPFDAKRSWKDFVPKIVRLAALGFLGFALGQGLSHLSTVDRTILGTGDDASKSRLQLEDMNKKIDAITRQLAERQASQNPRPPTQADIDRKVQELKPKVSSAVRGATCAGKPNGAICADIPGVGRGYCTFGMCANFSGP